MPYYSYNRYSGVSSNWGEVYGLKLQDLTKEQIHKLPLQKIMEFLPEPEIEQIVVNRINSRSFVIEELNYLINVLNNVTNFKEVCKNLVNAYNNYVYEVRQESSAGTDKTGSQQLMKELADDKNLYNELIRSMKFNDRNSLINITSIDKDYLRSVYNEEIYEHWQKFISDKLINGYISQYDLTKFVMFLNEERINLYCAYLKTFEDKNYYELCLANPLLNKNDTHDILKEIRKTVSNHTINSKIDEEILSRYATVTRLEVVEKIVFHSHFDTFPFVKELNKERITELLFGSSIKYNNRFTKAMQRYEYFYNDAYKKGDSDDQKSE